MSNRDVIILARSRNPTVDIKRTSLKGLLAWGSHIKQKHLTGRPSINAPARRIKARIEDNVSMPEWIGNHRFGIFDLLNYVNNGGRYVYDPSASPEFFDPIGIPSSTSVHIYDYLLKHDYNPINIDNFEGNRLELKEALKNNPLAVAISATFFNAETIKRIIHFVRKINRNVPIIIGSSVLLTKLDSNRRLETKFERLVSDKVYMILEEYGLDTLDLFL